MVFRTNLKRFLVLLSAGLLPVTAWAGAGEACHEADRLFAAGRSRAAGQALEEAVREPPGSGAAINVAVARRVVRQNGSLAVRLARLGEESAAQRAAATGAAVPRQVMRKPGVTCREVQAGAALWFQAAQDQERVWQALGRRGETARARRSRLAMQGVYRRVISPRAARFDRTPRRGTKQDRAEAEALVRLWEHELVRSALPLPTP